MKKIAIAILAALVVSLSTPGFAGGDPPPFPCPEGGRHAPPGFMGVMEPPGFDIPMLLHPAAVRHLNLSSEQAAKMAAVRDKADKEARDLAYKLAHIRLEMRELFSDPRVKEAALIEKQKELSAIGGKLNAVRTQAAIRMRSILTAEQIGRLDRMPPPPQDIFEEDRWEGPCDE